MNRVLFGDCRESLRQLAADGVRVQTCVTSPPYFGLRDYGVAGQLGLEQTPDEYVAGMVEVFRGVRDVLADDGTLWLNIGDSYAGSWGAQGRRETPPTLSRNQIANHPKRASGTGTIRQAGLKPKDMIGIPWMLAFALRADGWYLRQEIIWHKPNPMPESVRDRCTKAHESIFLLSKSPRYFIDQDGIREPAVSTHGPGNKTHRGATAYEDGDKHHRTKAGLVAYAERTRARYAVPTGWDTEPGAHGAFHREGRAQRGSMRNSFARASKDTTSEHGQKPQHRQGRDEVHYDGPTRNRRSVWTIPTRPYKGAHFAVFPPALIEPCILAGTSERGHCPACGARWVRDVERQTTMQSNSARAGRTVDEVNSSGKHIGGVNGGNRALKSGPVVTSCTLGWRPTCSCGIDPVPDVVLDPFMGSGTTAEVAILHGRQFLGCELKDAYKPLQDARIDAALALVRERDAQLRLFDEAV